MRLHRRAAIMGMATMPLARMAGTCKRTGLARLQPWWVHMSADGACMHAALAAVAPAWC